MRVRRKRVETGRVCCACREAVARAGQWDCRACANAALRRFRARRKKEIEALRQRLRELGR